MRAEGEQLSDPGSGRASRALCDEIRVGQRGDSDGDDPDALST
jgi:hypothetical protein